MWEEADIGRVYYCYTAGFISAATVDQLLESEFSGIKSVFTFASIYDTLHFGTQHAFARTFAVSTSLAPRTPVE
jgi:hypothetical protein